ncbi:hypothetical protein ACFXAZ_38455, partial [Streptomyces sp. NPDC059477]|uniref:hypothetical protein n=1 Tax=Streptomyces sp. NPDC059477 TaxID=3346847 RepID=UPI0036C5748B
MTPTQTATVAALGGLAAVISLALVVTLAIGLYQLTTRIIDTRDAHREHRRTLADFRHQLDALPTTHPPHEEEEKHQLTPRRCGGGGGGAGAG